MDCSLEFIERFEDKIDWFYVSMNKNLSDDFIIRNKDKDKLNFSDISEWCSLEIFEELEYKINWDFASKNKNLSIKLIRKHSIHEFDWDELDWNEIAKWCSQDILEEFKDRFLLNEN